jgi:hypothetical protein
VALWVPVTLHTSRHLLILVEQSAESVASSYVVDLGGCLVGEWSEGSGLAEGAVRPVRVGVKSVRGAVPVFRPARFPRTASRTRRATLTATGSP